MLDLYQFLFVASEIDLRDIEILPAILIIINALLLLVQILHGIYQFLMFFVVTRQLLFFPSFLSSELGKVVWMMFDSLTAMKDAT